MANIILTAQQLEMLDDEQIALYYALKEMVVITETFAVSDAFSKGINAYEAMMPGIEFEELVDNFLDLMCHASISDSRVFMKLTNEEIPDGLVFAEGCSKKARSEYSEDVW